jgi:hypothetical protein
MRTTEHLFIYGLFINAVTDYTYSVECNDMLMLHNDLERIWTEEVMI